MWHLPGPYSSLKFLLWLIYVLTACRGVGARALSNGINSAVFFCFFEALRATFAQKKKEQVSYGHAC